MLLSFERGAHFSPLLSGKGFSEVMMLLPYPSSTQFRTSLRKEMFSKHDMVRSRADAFAARRLVHKLAPFFTIKLDVSHLSGLPFIHLHFVHNLNSRSQTLR